jgi:Mrp family chromosome partitioning ATPase
VGAVPHDVIRRAAAQMEAVNARILGVLLNSVNMRREGYYYDYYRYYHRYYGGENK